MHSSLATAAVLASCLVLSLGCEHKPTNPPQSQTPSNSPDPGATGATAGRKSDNAPATPTNLSADRTAVNSYVRVTWNGETIDYDFQDSYQDTGTGRWSDSNPEKLRPAQTLPAPSGKYFKDDNALPQPMRFRVRAVRKDEHNNEIRSEWTDWVVSNP